MAKFQTNKIDHTGVTVSDIDASLAFWRDVFGFAVTEKRRLKGEFFETLAGVPGAELEVADIDAVIAAIRAGGYEPVSPPLTAEAGLRKGWRARLCPRSRRQRDRVFGAASLTGFSAPARPDWRGRAIGIDPPTP